jgi:hypothetical protein
MKSRIRYALALLTLTSIAAHAEDALPLCGERNFDSVQRLYTTSKPVGDVVNQQCTLIVYAKGAKPKMAAVSPASYVVAGRYKIEIAGGGGGGGGGGMLNQGGGGGGAGSNAIETFQFLAVGTYRLTIGTGGEGGAANGGKTEFGNPSSIEESSSGLLIAGARGAGHWQQLLQGPAQGAGGVATGDGGSGGDGAKSSEGQRDLAVAGGPSGMVDSDSTAGRVAAVNQSASASSRPPRSNAGGGGGASLGNGGDGELDGDKGSANDGNLGGGGGGGRGGFWTAHAGGRGGEGFIRLIPAEGVATSH